MLLIALASLDFRLCSKMCYMCKNIIAYIVQVSQYIIFIKSLSTIRVKTVFFSLNITLSKPMTSTSEYVHMDCLDLNVSRCYA